MDHLDLTWLNDQPRDDDREPIEITDDDGTTESETYMMLDDGTLVRVRVNPEHE